MRRFVPCLLILVVFAPLLSRAKAETTPLPGNFMGMVVRDPYYEWQTNPNYLGVNRAFYDAMGANLQAAGVKWVRIEFVAESTQASGSSVPPGQVYVDKYRYFVNTVAPRYGLKVLGLLATPLVRDASGNYLDPELIEAGLGNATCNNSTAYGYTNQYMCIWLRNAFTVANAFPYDKTTGAGIAAYEVLNEENRYLNGNGKGMNPSAVGTLLTKFYRVFRQNQDPGGNYGAWRNDVSIILGGLHPDYCTDCAPSPGMNDRDYLDAVYNSGPLQGYKSAYGQYPLDGVGYHPYPMEMVNNLVPEPTGYPELYRVPTRMSQIRQVMLANGDAAHNIWVTEVGDRGAPRTVDPPGDNEQRQAQFLQSVYWMLWQDRDFVQTVFWFKYEDFNVPSDPTAIGPENWGVVRLQPRPSSQYQCTNCIYEMNGNVQVYKQSYYTYAGIALSGTGLQTYTTYLPVVMSNSGP